MKRGTRMLLGISVALITAASLHFTVGDRFQDRHGWGRHGWGRPGWGHYGHRDCGDSHFQSPKNQQDNVQ
ncbi:hypothetical protein [Dyadobacter sp. CY347]|uniref:hypothetical protein n=1 Tax=Dyadobacter sp. CY347 TaxID=2909336 RepID=UPI001F1E6597|nr:hypothetical protein [Dyadobacter sp. CY347]MCF2488386.1 hypothetical protein [Dyadobacter sp. CY347]